jgi:hypothetical protein
LGEGKRNMKIKIVGNVWWTGVVGILGLGARKFDLLELGSQRDSVPSWMGGKYHVFREFQLTIGKFQLATSKRD